MFYRSSLTLLCFFLLACDPQANFTNSVNSSTELRRAELQAEFHACERNSRTLAPALVHEARCILVRVPENPQEADGAWLDLKVMIIPAIKALPASDPFFILAGGPGEAASEAGLSLVPAFGRIRLNRDIVLLDQRGTGVLSPFNCNPDIDAAEQLTSLDAILAEQHERLSRCLSELEEQGIRAEYYTTDIAVQDIEAVRRYLGYEQLNLWGGSYGTRVALSYLQTYPQFSRSIVVDGVAPPGMLFTSVNQDASAAFERMLTACEQETACQTAFPDLRTELDELLLRLETPQSVSLRNARTGVQETAFELDSEVLKVLLTQVLYSREFTRLLPLMIHEMYQGSFQSLAVLLAAGQSELNQGMHYSVLCNEDYALIEPGELEAEFQREGLLVNQLSLRPRIEACRLWPKRSIDADFFASPDANRPVLILSGEQDPVTPPYLGENLAQSLPDSLHIVAKGVGHISSHYACVRDLLADFVETAELSSLDTSCMANLQARPFFTTSGGVSLD